MSKIPTTREIAAACGCSQPTVSRALADNPEIKQETRARIKEIARKLGWKPNPLASAYMAHLRSTRDVSYKATLAFLIPTKESPLVSRLPIHNQRHFNGAKARALELGYQIDTIWLHEPGLTARRLFRILQNRNIPGMIIPKIHGAPECLQGFDWRPFACSALGYSLMEPAFDRVATHTLHGFNMVFRKARELGYRHIGVVVAEEYAELVDHTILSAALYQKFRMEGECRVDLFTFPTCGNEHIPAVQEWLRAHRPQVVIGSIPLPEAIQAMKWRVPQDVAFMAADRAPEYPDTGGFNQVHEEHGALAVDLVVARLLHNERGVPRKPKLLLVEGRWEDGISVPEFSKIRTLKSSARLAL